MQTTLFKPATVAAPKPKRKATLIKAIAATVVLGSFGGAGWWWFRGSKPKLAASIAFKTDEFGETGTWAVSNGRMLTLAGGKLILVDLKERKEKWSTAIPAQPEVDVEFQAALSARFLKLQQRADELSAKRATLKGDASVKAFNAEAAKYAADLAAARADAVRGTAAKVAPAPAAKPVAAAPKKYEFGGDRSTVDKLNTVQNEADLLRATRAKAREQKIAEARANIEKLKPTATTPIKQQQLREAEVRLASLEAEQKADAVAVIAPAAPKGEPTEKFEPEPDFAFAHDRDPHVVEAGGLFYLTDGPRILSFEAEGGAIKGRFPMPGTVLEMFECGGTVYAAAHAGETVRYIVKIAPDGNAQGLYAQVAGDSPLFEQTEGSYSVLTPAARSIVTGGGSLAIADVRLVTQKIEKRNVIKPGADKAAEENTKLNAGGGTEEALAIMAVMEQDKLRMSGRAVEQIDASTYDVSIRRPFAPTAAPWKGQFTGHVQCFYTRNFTLVTASTKLVALNANNEKAWEASLTAPAVIGEDSQWDSQPAPPCFEAAGRLYFFDRAALNAFDAATGAALWRVPSVGIRKVVTDANGDLYVHSANLPTDSLQFISERSKMVNPVLFKVAAKTGAIEWSQDKYEDVWAEGGDLYALRIGKNAADIENQVFAPGTAPEARVKIFKLTRGAGKPRWEWFQTKMPHDVVTFGKTLAIRFRDEVQIVHSTAL